MFKSGSYDYSLKKTPYENFSNYTKTNLPIRLLNVIELSNRNNNNNVVSKNADSERSNENDDIDSDFRTT